MQLWGIVQKRRMLALLPLLLVLCQAGCKSLHTELSVTSDSRTQPPLVPAAAKLDITLSVESEGVFRISRTTLSCTQIAEYLRSWSETRGIYHLGTDGSQSSLKLNLYVRSITSDVSAVNTWARTYRTGQGLLNLTIIVPLFLGQPNPILFLSTDATVWCELVSTDTQKRVFAKLVHGHAKSSQQTRQVTTNMIRLAGNEAVADAMQTFMREAFAAPEFSDLAADIGWLQAAQSAATQPSDFDFVEATAALPAIDTARETIAVIDFDMPESHNARVGRAFADLVRHAIDKSEHYRLLNRQNMVSILGEEDFAHVIKCAPGDSLSPYGRKLRAQKMVHGSICPVEKTLIFTLTITDVETGVIDATRSFVAKRQHDFLEAINDETFKLIEEALR